MLTTDFGGLFVLDVQDASAPNAIGLYAVTSAEALFVAGGVALVGAGGRLVAVDLQDPTNPSETTALQLPDGTLDIYVAANRAYVAGRRRALWILDVGC